MKWTLECVRKGARDTVVLGTFDSAEAAVVAAEGQSPRGVHWTILQDSRIGVAGDRQYMIRKALVSATSCELFAQGTSTSASRNSREESRSSAARSSSM